MSRLGLRIEGGELSVERFEVLGFRVEGDILQESIAPLCEPQDALRLYTISDFRHSDCT
jgi:hypothetical protein